MSKFKNENPKASPADREDADRWGDPNYRPPNERTRRSERLDELEQERWGC